MMRDQPTKAATIFPVLVLLFVFLASACSDDEWSKAVDFEDVGLGDEAHYIGDATGIQTWTSGDATFLLFFDDEWGEYWEGFAASTESDTSTPGFANQYSAIPGGGQGGSKTFGVGYTGGYSVPAELRFPGAGAGVEVGGLYVTNTTFVYLSMRDGDSFAKKFGGDNGTDPDWLLLTIEGIASSGGTTGEVRFYLADFRSDDPAEDYLVGKWTFVDLTSLGRVVGLRFYLDSSDQGDWGMNTPAYFALDRILVEDKP
ncbi:MAG: DUF4465 domain-containing protein [Polyangia bacterium]|jgi:hypothetical protein|nr:DUF4465 domain-containing protein [Polyangia bacterium]